MVIGYVDRVYVDRAGVSTLRPLTFYPVLLYGPCVFLLLVLDAGSIHKNVEQSGECVLYVRLLVGRYLFY